MVVVGVTVHEAQGAAGRHHAEEGHEALVFLGDHHWRRSGTHHGWHGRLHEHHHIGHRLAFLVGHEQLHRARLRRPATGA